MLAILMPAHSVCPEAAATPVIGRKTPILTVPGFFAAKEGPKKQKVKDKVKSHTSNFFIFHLIKLTKS